MRLGKEDFRKLLNEPMLEWVDCERAILRRARRQVVDVRLPSEFENIISLARSICRSISFD